MIAAQGIAMPVGMVQQLVEPVIEQGSSSDVV